MGCQNSKSGTKEELEQDKEIGDFLTPEEIEIIRNSWDIVKQDIPGTGIYMFTRMMSRHIGKPFALRHINRALHRKMIPDRCIKAHARYHCAFEVLKLFELQSDFKKFFKRMMTQTETGEYDFDWNKLGNHANIVMTALDNAVDSMGDSSYLSKGLLELGERHKMYNVKPEMVPLMWPAVRDALKQALAEDFTVETELAWKHVFDYIVCKMAQGMRRPDKTPSSARAQNANGVPS